MVREEVILMASFFCLKMEKEAYSLYCEKFSQ